MKRTYTAAFLLLLSSTVFAYPPETFARDLDRALKTRTTPVFRYAPKSVLFALYMRQPSVKKMLANPGDRRMALDYGKQTITAMLEKMQKDRRKAVSIWESLLKKTAASKQWRLLRLKIFLLRNKTFRTHDLVLTFSRGDSLSGTSHEFKLLVKGVVHQDRFYITSFKEDDF